ncbi:unnamed protein product [Caenorhabditis bovis]|uniref:Guanine nucleotide exchange factor rei n=1 Tax=Caenorhabditis bovis TaxID=2654633 RepID=A0A8S1EFS2_9PELO|nr:unnamed protein product [Caenorhabditis bovis]
MSIAATSSDASTEISDRDSRFSCEDEEHPPLESRHLNLIHEELEKLNIATDVINKMEVQLDSARAEFRETQVQWSEKLKELSKQYSSQIAKARPYYELKIEERKLREESQKAAERFERATSLLAVAKQQVCLTQDSLSRQTSVLPECLEVLNHHIQRVSEVEEERMMAEALHASKAYSMLQLAEKIRAMEKENRSAIKKSRHYFEKRLEFTRILEQQKATILKLEAEVRQKKSDYTTSLRNLERISEQIHEERSTGSSDVGSMDHVETESFAGSECNGIPGNPPPYAPTAPPPYEDQYIIEKDDDSLVLNMMKEEQEECGDKRNSRSLGSGVILLAQQLMGNSTEKQQISFSKFGEEADISYHTRPAGLSPSSDNSEDIENATDRVGSILKPTMKSVSDVQQQPQPQHA